ncbi:MAG TPA: Ldh family oxidoreductase [Bryobacteraceae bacterium]|nr:Ldh family oxidoreductase [Bryobacteraceae bacterium]
MTNDVTISSHDLIAFGSKLLEATGVTPERAHLVAASLVAADLRGVDSHGIQSLPFYIRQIEHSSIRIDAEGHVLSETGGLALYDGENGLGQVVSQRCTELAIRLGREHGFGVVVARESNHFGAAAYWAQQISAEGFIGIVMCDASHVVPPWQGREGRIGTNPICMSVPGEEWLLDMATTTVARGKMLKAVLRGDKEIPAGWALDKDGVPTTDPEAAMAGLPMPLGGYKGSGLAMMVEILCGVLSGGAMATQVGGIHFYTQPARISQFFLALDVSRFMPLDQFRARVAHLVAEVKSAPPALGYDEVLVAGEPERRVESQRCREGITIPAGVWAKLTENARKWNVPVP